MTWKTVELGDLIVLQRGHDLPSHSRVIGSVPIISSSGVSGFHHEAKENPPGVVTGRYGTIGKIFYVNEPYWPLNTTLYVKDFKGNNPKFIAYLLECLNLEDMNAAGAVPGVNRNHLYKIRTSVPTSKALQDQIAAILSAYDDLIENNLQRIKLLEEMAQITYEEWFVRMKFPGHETAQWDKETGLPEGWIEQNLSDFISIKHGFAYKGEYFTDSETSRVLLTPGNFKIGGGLKSDKFKFYENSAESPNEYVLKKHDLLITMTDLSKMADTLGYPLLVPSSSDKVYLHNQRLGKVLPCKNKLSPTYFYYMFFKNENYRGFVVGSASGATVKHTSPSKILAFKPKLPPLDGELVFQFDELVKPMFEVTDGLQRQNELLREAREILLPRLMTGVIDVDQVEVPEALLARVA